MITSPKAETTGHQTLLVLVHPAWPWRFIKRGLSRPESRRGARQRMRRYLDVLEQVADRDGPLLVVGDPGNGCRGPWSPVLKLLRRKAESVMAPDLFRASKRIRAWAADREGIRRVRIAGFYGNLCVRQLAGLLPEAQVDRKLSPRRWCN